MHLRLGLPAGLFLMLLFFYLLPSPAHAASWQKMPLIPTTNVSSFATLDGAVFAGVNQYLSNRASENGVYKIGSDGNAAKIYSNSQFRISNLVQANQMLFAAITNSGTFGPSGVYKSTGGTLWNLTSTDVVGPLKIAATDTVLLAITYDSVWRSEDLGTTWQRTLQHGSFDQFHDVVISGNVALVSSLYGFYRSEDAGKTWEQLHPPQNSWQQLGISGSIALAGGDFQGFMRSEDSGKTWQVIYPLDFTGEQPTGPFAFASQTHIFAGGYHQGTSGLTGTVFESHDGGKTWQKIDDGIAHSITSTQQVRDIFVAPNYIYMALSQDGVFFMPNTEISSAETKTPLILIPGIGGSELVAKKAFNHSASDGHGGTFTHDYKAGETVWVNTGEALKPGNDDYFDALRMQSDGVTPLHEEIEPNGQFVNTAYSAFSQFFIDKGYELNKTLFLYPYDWRRDITNASDLLDQKVDEILLATGAAKVDIVGHSMGGLVARKYIADAPHAQKVRKLVTLGAPFLGSVKAIKSLHYGDCLDVGLLNNCVGINRNEVNDVVQNLTSNFELIPSRDYYYSYNNSNLQHPYPFRDDRDVDRNGITGPLDYEQTKELLTNLKHNTNLFEQAQEFHVLDQLLTESHSVEVHTIAGSGKCTLGRIREYTKTNFFGKETNKVESGMINGDGTVPLYSADFTGAYYTNQDHGALARDGIALELTNSLLDGDTSLPSGVQSSPYKSNCKQISVLSPVSLDVYDETGNHTGLDSNGNFEANIPDSNYDELGETKAVILPDTGTFTIKLQGLDTGSFDVKISSISDDATTSQIVYNDIPVSTNASASFTYNTNSSTPPTIVLDPDNSGTKKVNIEPTNVLSQNSLNDFAAPHSTYNLDGVSGNYNWYKSDVVVTLSAADDDNGSGIAKIEYSLDDGLTINTYAGPFKISQEGVTKLQFRSVDNAGNQEAPQYVEIKIDKSAPEAIVTYNPDDKKFDVFGIDNLEGEVNVTTQQNTYTLADLVGNQTILTTKQSAGSNNEFSVTKIKYGDNPEKKLTTNRFITVESGHTLTQRIVIKNEERLRAEYDAANSTTKVINKKPKQKKQEMISSGLILLQLSTKSGDIDGYY